MYGTRELPPSHSLHRLVAGLARNAESPIPKVYEMDNDQPNDFATERNPENAAVAAGLEPQRRTDDGLHPAYCHFHLSIKPHLKMPVFLWTRLCKWLSAL